MSLAGRLAGRQPRHQEKTFYQGKAGKTSKKPADKENRRKKPNALFIEDEGNAGIPFLLAKEAAARPLSMASAASREATEGH